MAQHDGYEYVAHDSYDAFRASTINQGWNVDYYAGNQCFDLVALLYYQYNLRLITKPGGGGAADCWLVSKDANAKPPFIAVTGKENIKRGDIIVWNRTRQSSTGHIAFADENYNGSNRIRTFGQTPSLHGVNGVASLDDLGLSAFLGIFRNTQWDSTPGERVESEKKEKFPWVIAWNNWKGYR